MFIFNLGVVDSVDHQDVLSDPRLVNEHHVL